MYTLLITFFLVATLLSFLCSLWEAVLLSITPMYAEIKMHEGTFEGRQLRHFKNHIDKPLAAILTLNTFAHTVGAIGVGEQATLIWQDSNPMITGLLIPILMTLAILIFSEIIPKTIGAYYWKKLSTFTVYSLSLLIKILYPLVYLCQVVTKGFRGKQVKSIFTRTDFARMAEIGEAHGVLHAEESDMIEKALDLYEIRVTEVMRPARDMVMINLDTTQKSLLKLINKHRYSRYPVYDPNQKEIIGILHVKDLFKQNKLNEFPNIKDIMRPVMKIPVDLPVNQLLKKFQEGMPHFALIYNENNELFGFITLDNVLQVLLGIIKDEFNPTHVDWTANSDGSISASGFCSIYALEQALDRDIEVEGNISTLAGLILDRLERMPEKDEVIEFPEFDMKTEKVVGARILRVVVYPKNEE